MTWSDKDSHRLAESPAAAGQAETESYRAIKGTRGTVDLHFKKQNRSRQKSKPVDKRGNINFYYGNYQLLPLLFQIKTKQNKKAN